MLEAGVVCVVRVVYGPHGAAVVAFALSQSLSNPCVLLMRDPGRLECHSPRAESTLGIFEISRPRPCWSCSNGIPTRPGAGTSLPLAETTRAEQSLPSIPRACHVRPRKRLHHPSMYKAARLGLAAVTSQFFGWSLPISTAAADTHKRVTFLIRLKTKVVSLHQARSTTIKFNY